MEPDEAAILHNFIRGQDSSDDMVAIILILRDLLGVDGILRIVDWLGRGADILPIRFLGDQPRREWPVRLVPVHSPGMLAAQDAETVDTLQKSPQYSQRSICELGDLDGMLVQETSNAA